MRLLGITGRVLTPKGLFVGTIGAGKDTVADRLRQAHNYATYSLAEPIKRMLSALPGFEMYKWDDRAWKEAVHPLFGATRRFMAQTLGTEWRNLICEDLWLRVAAQRWEQVQQMPVAGMVIPDIRFEHEVEWLRALGGQLIVVIRDNGVDGPVGAHPSEAGVQTRSEDFFIYNTSTIPNLHETVDVLAETLRAAEVV